MRALLGCSLGGRGHLAPLIAVATTLQALGHEAVALVPPSLADAAGEAGIAFRVGGEPGRHVVDATWDRVRTGPPEDVVGLIDRELFANHCTRAMLGPALQACADWQPDIVVREPCEYATALAAHRAGVPQLQVGISQAALEHAVLEDVAPVLAGFEEGLVPAIKASPYLSSFPARLDPSPWPDTRRFRVNPPAPQPLPDWWPGDQRPLIYVTFGTVLGHLSEAREVYRSALEAVSEVPARILMTVGPSIDPAALGPVAANTHIEQWVPQHDAFAQARLVVCHGGSGTTFGALAAGLPLVLCPLFADQRANADLIDQAGLGVVHHPVQARMGGVARLGAADVAPLRAAIVGQLHNSVHRAAARQLAADIARAPTLEATLSELLCTAA